MFSLIFYKELYLDEKKRKTEIDNSISYPTTLLTLLIGAAFFIIKTIGISSILCGKVFYAVIAIISLIGFSTTIIYTITLLLAVFANSFNKYKYLPSPTELQKREVELVKFYENTPEKNKTALESASNNFENDLLNYYIDIADKNQKLNNKRIKSYYLAKKFLIISIIFLTTFGTTSLLK